ncbi:MAG: hypothetical protein MRZ61_10005 [Oscillospiraceae bacterium]|nr:hypothetical protein [Oscillospiraceae bacterium]
MANIKTGVCPSCGKERELAYIKFGVIQSTMCVYCLHKYLERCIIPRLRKNNDETTDKCQIGENGVVIGGYLNNEQSAV